MQPTQPARHFVLIMSALSLIILILIGANWFYLTHPERSQSPDFLGSFGLPSSPSVQIVVPSAQIR